MEEEEAQEKVQKKRERKRIRMRKSSQGVFLVMTKNVFVPV